MAAYPVVARCRNCGGFLTGLTYAGAPAVPYQCPHCGHPVAVLGPRPLPPLFSWEVYPHLYPAAGPVRLTPRRLGPAIVVLLLLTCGALMPAVALIAQAGFQALVPGTTTVSGTVDSQLTPAGTPSPVAGATVVVEGENGYVARATTDSAGGFVLPGVPYGGILVNASHLGYGYASELVFVSVAYTSPAQGGQGLTLTLLPRINSTLVDSPFPDLETLETNVVSSIILILVAAGLCIAGVFLGVLHRRLPWAVVGGAAAFLALVAAGILGVADFALLAAFAVLIAALLGLAAAILALVPLSLRATTVTPL